MKLNFKKILKLETYINIAADVLASKWTFLIFLLMAIIPLIFTMPNSILLWQAYISQTFIQLVALAVLSYQNKRTEKKLFRKIEEELTLLRDILNQHKK